MRLDFGKKELLCQTNMLKPLIFALVKSNIFKNERNLASGLRGYHPAQSHQNGMTRCPGNGDRSAPSS
jgi:hypothetical protein